MVFSLVAIDKIGHNIAFLSPQLELSDKFLRSMIFGPLEFETDLLSDFLRKEVC